MAQTAGAGPIRGFYENFKGSKEARLSTMSLDSVSVIVPCYNSSRFVRKTVESILNQVYKPREVIVIDDGSTDDTEEILRGFFPCIRILHHPDSANLGQGASLNLGIGEANGDLIAFLDSDDLWFPRKLEEQVKIFQTVQDVGVVYTNGYAIDGNDRILYKLFAEDFQEENIRGRILLNCYISGGASTIMVKKDIFKLTGLFDTNLQAMDHDMWIKMSEVTKFYYIPECLMAYRRHSFQQSLGRKQWEDGFKILRNARNRYPYGCNVIRKRLGVLYYRLGEHDYKKGDYLRALLNCTLSAICCPIRGFFFLLKLLCRT